jgi:hypothetical protein
MQEREGAVLQLHHHSVTGLFALGEVNEVDDYGLVGTQKVAVGDPKEQRVANVSSGTCDRDANGGLAHGLYLLH